MTNNNSLAQRWREFSPSKAMWLWSCVFCAALTMIVGFTAGGWVTNGRANGMVEQASRDARANLVASICVDRFVADPNAALNFVELKKASRWSRDKLIEDGGWSFIKAIDEQVSAAADVCADRIAAMEALPIAEAVPNQADQTNLSADG